MPAPERSAAAQAPSLHVMRGSGEPASPVSTLDLDGLGRLRSVRQFWQPARAAQARRRRALATSCSHRPFHHPADRMPKADPWARRARAGCPRPSSRRRGNTSHRTRRSCVLLGVLDIRARDVVGRARGERRRARRDAGGEEGGADRASRDHEASRPAPKRYLDRSGRRSGDGPFGIRREAHEARGAMTRATAAARREVGWDSYWSSWKWTSAKSRTRRRRKSGSFFATGSGK